jgi:histidinol-phosphatase (PHP family)
MAILTDMHIHSHFSPDSNASVNECCEAALARGLLRICITDHVEFNPKDDGYGFYCPDDYLAAVARSRERYGAHLELLSGVEIGGGPHIHPGEYTECVARKYDFILVSVHDWYEGMFASQMVKLGMRLRQSYGLYWDEVYQTVCHGGFDALAHFDFPKRYYREVFYDWEKIKKIFTVMVDNGIALEINTSSLREGLKEPMPGREVLDFYRKCGGEFLTIGSDAHRHGDIGGQFDVIEPLTAGFTQVYFKGRVRYTVNLES